MSLLTTLLMAASPALAEKQEAPQVTPLPETCEVGFLKQVEESGWRPQQRWGHEVNLGYAQHQRVRLEGGREYHVASCHGAEDLELRISVYDSRAMVRVQTWADEVTFVAPKTGDFSIGVETPPTEDAPVDVVFILSSS
jgi:hypothetical protein